MWTFRCSAIWTRRNLASGRGFRPDADSCRNLSGYQMRLRRANTARPPTTLHRWKAIEGAGDYRLVAAGLSPSSWPRSAGARKGEGQTREPLVLRCRQLCIAASSMARKRMSATGISPLRHKDGLDVDLATRWPARDVRAAAAGPNECWKWPTAHGVPHRRAVHRQQPSQRLQEGRRRTAGTTPRRRLARPACSLSAYSLMTRRSTTACRCSTQPTHFRVRQRTAPGARAQRLRQGALRTGG